MIVSTATFEGMIGGLLLFICVIITVQNGLRLVQWLGKPGAEGRGDRLLGALVGLTIAGLGYASLIRKFLL